jgi:hypothetical protein
MYAVQVSNLAKRFCATQADLILVDVKVLDKSPVLNMESDWFGLRARVERSVPL